MTTADRLDNREWARRFAVLADPTRLGLLIAMHEHPGRSVLQLAEDSGTTPNAASQALRALRDHGWVLRERDGRTIRYYLNNDEIVHRVLHDIVGAHH